jgi:hypothetical protein
MSDLGMPRYQALLGEITGWAQARPPVGGPAGTSQPGSPAASSGATTAAGAAGRTAATAQEIPRRHANYLLWVPYGSAVRSVRTPR